MNRFTELHIQYHNVYTSWKATKNVVKKTVLENELDNIRDELSQLRTTLNQSVL